MILDRIFPPHQYDEAVGAAYQRGDTRWWRAGGAHDHTQTPVPTWWPVMDDEGEVA